MDVAALARIVTPVTNTLFVIVPAAGYYYTWKSSQSTLREMQAQRKGMADLVRAVERLDTGRDGETNQ